jgi:hypothetical protein
VGFEPAVRAYRLFRREHRGLAERTIGKRARQLGQFAVFAEQAGVPTARTFTPPPFSGSLRSSLRHR